MSQPVDDGPVGRIRAQEVDGALARVLGSATFARAARARDVLAYVVGETLAGRGHDVKERTVARHALGRPADIDTRTDPSARVQISRVRSLLARYYEREGRHDAVRITIPRGTYAAVFTRPGPEVASRPVGSGSAERATTGPLLAVVQLVPTGSQTSDRRAAIGLTETLVQALTRFPGLRVMGPLAATRADADRFDIDEIAARTGADFVLHGNVRDRDGLLRLVVHLVDAATGELRWSERFDRDASAFNGFGAEDDIVGHVAGTIADYRGVILRGPVHARPPAATAGVFAALSAYYAFLDDLDPDAALAAVVALEEALDAEPDNPLVAGVLASMYGIDVLMRGAEEAASSLDRAEGLGREALRLDPTSAPAHSVLGVVSLARGRSDEARMHARTLLALTPYHPTHLYTAGMVLGACDAWDEGIAVIRRAVALNPHHPTHERTLLAIDALMHDDLEEALQHAQVLHFPGYVYGPLLRAICYSLLGDAASTSDEVAELREVCPDFFDRPAAVLGAAPTMPDHAVDHLVGRLGVVRSTLSSARVGTER